MNARGELVHAFVLHTRPYKEKSRLIDLWTLEQGRLTAAGKPTVSLFQPCLVNLRGKSTLKSLAHCEAAGQPLLLAGDGLFAGFYLNELIVRLLPFDELQPELFALYSEALTQITMPEQLEPTLRRFERCLLAVLGYGVIFHQDSAGEAIQPQQYYHYLPHQGFVPAEQGYQGQQLLMIAADDYHDVAAKRIAKQILRQALAVLLGNKPLKSRELWLTKAS